MKTGTKRVLFSLLCSVLLPWLAAASWSPTVDDWRLDVEGEVWPQLSVGLATDWQFCLQKCRELSLCVLFTWRSVERSCQLFQAKQTFSGVNQFISSGVMGRIERSNGSLLWLSLGGFPSIAPSAQMFTISTEQECRDACENSVDLLPCAAVQLVPSRTCELYAGYFTGYTTLGEYNPLYKATSHRLNSTEPTGNGTLIRAANLPPSPPNVTAAPYTRTNITAGDLGYPASLIPLTVTTGETFDECAQKCHDNPTCRSFQSLEGQNCSLFDVALRGTFKLDAYNYGVIDRDAAVSTVTYVVPSHFDLAFVILATYTPVITMEECAMICYQFHQPIHCTSFQLDSGKSVCQLYSGEIQGWTSSSVSAPVNNDFSYGVIEGRKPYNHRYDAGVPMNQLIQTTTTTTSKPTTTTTTTTQTTTTTKPTTTTMTTTTAAPCTPRKSSVTLFAVMQKGARITSPSNNITNDVSIRQHCALLCHQNQLCRSFSYSQSKKECHQHCLQLGDPEVVVATDPEFFISSSFGNEV